MSTQKMGDGIRKYGAGSPGSVHRLLNQYFPSPVGLRYPGMVGIFQKVIPDIDFYCGLMDWDKARTKTDAVIIRAGQGATPDPQFARNWQEAKRVGMKRGVYWFSDDRFSPGSQADLLHSLIKNDPPEMEVINDWERTFNGSFAGLKNVVANMERLESFGYRVGMYTGYYWFIDHSNALTNASQYNYLKTRPLWLAWFVLDSSIVKIPAPWSDVWMWQYGTPAVGLSYGSQALEIDLSYFNGTQLVFESRYGAVSPPAPDLQDSEVLKVRRYGSDCYILRVVPEDNRVLVTKPISAGKLEKTSDAVRRYGAKFGINGDGWWSLDDSPLSLAASDGNLYSDKQYDGRPFLHITKDGIASIGSRLPENPYNLVSGTRQIVKDGACSLDETDPAYSEALSPRTAVFVDRSGRILCVVVDGRSESDSGCSLVALAAIGIEFGAVDGLELDGGGSSSMVADGNLVNTPSDPVGERAVVNHLIFFGGLAMADYLVIKGTDGANHRVRNNPDVRSPYLAGKDINNNVSAKAGVTTADIKVFDADVPDSTIAGGLAAKKGDTWRRVFEVGGVSTLGWTAEIHLGTRQGISITPYPTVPPPPPPSSLPEIPYSITLGDDITYTKQVITGTLKPKA